MRDDPKREENLFSPADADPPRRETDEESPEHAPVSSVPERASSVPSDDFWDLGAPKPRIYAKPSFEGRTVGVTDVSAPDPPGRNSAHSKAADEAVNEVRNEVINEVRNEVTNEARNEVINEARNEVINEAQAEKIVPREEFERTHPSAGPLIGAVRTDGARTVNTIDGPRYVTGSYRRRQPPRRPSAPPKREPSPPAVVRSYQPDGPLLRRIDVRTWDSDVEFYGRFYTDAVQSHRALPSVPYTEKAEAAPYFSYVPQYAHMNGKQVEFYRWVRENIRRGRYPDCDLPYLQLYIFEILNLTNEIPAEEGAELLASLWLGYRERWPRLDGCLCDWLPDYCMIHAAPLPDSLRSLLPLLVPKAQFKEFYLNIAPDSEENRLLLSRCLIETLSDYDFRGSRYYAENKEEYEAKIPAAVAFALGCAMEEKRGMFSLDRVYRMTRDSYCGAIVASAVKRRLDIEFCSFTRRADNREVMTALVKYAENKVRALLGVKAKLGSAGLDPSDAAAVDRWFAPFIPQKGKKSAEDRYMPENYLKYYEAETSGFDRNAAAAIELESWVNTSRLTGEDYGLPAREAEYDPDETAAPEVEGELSDLPLPETVPDALPAEQQTGSQTDRPAERQTEYQTEHPAERQTENQTERQTEQQSAPPDSADPEPAETGELPDEEQPEEPENSADAELAEALRAALDGSFRQYARSHGLYEGELADRINNRFLDLLGDVVLEDGGSGFALIEDYREDVEEWLSAP